MSEQVTDTATQYLPVQTCDGHKVMVHSSLIPYFNLFTSVYEDMDADNEDVLEINIAGCDKECIDHALVWATKLHELSSAAYTEDHIENELDEWCRCISDISINNLITLSDFLDSPQLGRTLARRIGMIADQYRCPRKLAQRLGITFDWTDEEYRQIKKDNAWMMANVEDPDQDNMDVDPVVDPVVNI